MKDSTLQPVVFMVGSMALFSLEDFFIKLLSHTIPASEIMFIMGVLGSIFFIMMAKAAQQPIFSLSLIHI